MKKINKIIGIDASNLIYGGGRTHIIEILDALNLHFLGFEKIIIWGSENTLSLIPNYFWLEKKTIIRKNNTLHYLIYYFLFFIFYFYMFFTTLHLAVHPHSNPTR